MLISGLTQWPFDFTRCVRTPGGGQDQICESFEDASGGEPRPGAPSGRGKLAEITGSRTGHGSEEYSSGPPARDCSTIRTQTRSRIKPKVSSQLVRALRIARGPK